MNRLEDRLTHASEDTRCVAIRSRPRPIERPAMPRRPGLLVFAAAFAAVLVVGLIPLLVGGDDPTPLGEVSPSTMATPTTIAVEPTTTGLETSCSATGVGIPDTPKRLPDAVAQKFTMIAQATGGCDLAALSSAAGDELVTSFGGGGFDNIVLWESDGSGQLGTLLKVLGTSYAVQEFEDRGDIYTWPAAFIYDTWEEIPADDVEELYEIYTEGELDQIAGLGSYAGWRVGIDETGDWMFFVAGD